MHFPNQQNCAKYLCRAGDFSNMIGFLEVYIIIDIPVLIPTPKLPEIIFWSLQQNWINICHVVFSLLRKTLMHFLENGVLSPKLGTLLSPWARLGPTCSNLLFSSQLDLSDAKQLGSFPSRAKTISFPYASVSYIISQQSYSPRD